MKSPLCITCSPEDLDQGLFGHVLANTFQVLPFLDEHKIFPAWSIRSLYYGNPPDKITIPGVVELAYTPPQGPYRTVSLSELRRRHGHILGSDWKALARLWQTYFRVPARVLGAANGLLPPGLTLGVHYRGTDKQTASWDSNPITQDDFLLLLKDFLAQRTAYDQIFVATDEPSFIDRLRCGVTLPVHDVGAGEHHMAASFTTTPLEKSDRAMLDCLLLSQCQTVVQTSSGLPSFAKILNPGLEVYRTAASKVFSNMPYFPVAHVPVLPVTTPEAKAILDRTMQEDWTTQPSTERFRSTFTAMPRWPGNHKLFSLAERAGAADFAAKFFRGYR